MNINEIKGEKVVSLADVRKAKNHVPETNMEILDFVTYSNGVAGSIGYVLCKDLTMGYTMGFMGVYRPEDVMTSKMNIAKFGSKLSKADAEKIFGSQENYKYS